MDKNFCWRHFFGAIDRFRERLIPADGGAFDVDIFSLTMSQQRLLRELALCAESSPEGISLKVLAEKLNLSSSAVSVMVEMLVQKKVLERRNSIVDRRQVLIRLSDAAWREVAKFDRSCNEFFTGFSDEEYAVLQKISLRLSGSDKK